MSTGSLLPFTTSQHTMYFRYVAFYRYTFSGSKRNAKKQKNAYSQHGEVTSDDVKCQMSSLHHSAYQLL